MKRVIFSALFCMVMLQFVYSQAIPVFVRQRLDSIKENIRTGLYEYRTSNNGYLLDRLSDSYPYGFSLQESMLIDSLGLNISIGMVYDDAMRNRIVQLIRNEYREEELDTLVNRFMNQNIIYFERQAMEIGKIDTLSIFRNTMDSLYVVLESENRLDMFKKLNKIYDYEMFKSLRLDTTTFFKQVYQNIIKNEREKAIKEITNNTYSYFLHVDDLVEISGYINDKRFIQPLIDVLNKPFDFNSTRKESIHKKVTEALVRMRAEPYYSDYVKKRTLTLEQVQNEYPGFDIQDLAFVLRNQESFLELSKYLLSEVAYSWNMPDLPPGVEGEKTPNPMSGEALMLIHDNIENKDLQQIVNVPHWWEKDEIKKPTYDWMQKNYGKYQIRRIW